MAIVVTGAMPDQARQLAALHAGIAGAAAWGHADILARIRAGTALAALAGTEIAGMLLWQHVAGEAEILVLCVGAGWRRQGAGMALLRTAEERAAGAGVYRIRLEVAGDNLPALALYRKAGYVREGLRRLYYPARAGREAQDALVLGREPRAALPQP